MRLFLILIYESKSLLNTHWNHQNSLYHSYINLIFHMGSYAWICCWIPIIKMTWHDTVHVHLHHLNCPYTTCTTTRKSKWWCSFTRTQFISHSTLPLFHVWNYFYVAVSMTMVLYSCLNKGPVQVWRMRSKTDQIILWYGWVTLHFEGWAQSNSFQSWIHYSGIVKNYPVVFLSMQDDWEYAQLAVERNCNLVA